MDTKPPYYDHVYYDLHFSTRDRIKLGFLQSCFIFSPRFYDLTPLIWFRISFESDLTRNESFECEMLVFKFSWCYTSWGAIKACIVYFSTPQLTPRLLILDTWAPPRHVHCAFFYNIAWYVSARFCICICMCICICICICMCMCICICICICIYIWICICILFVHLTPERPGDSIVRRASNMFPHNSHFTLKVIHLKKCLQNI